MTITEFLLARIAEDEAAASYAIDRGEFGRIEYGGQGFAAIQHAERWEPTRVLAECAAKRLVIEAAWDDHYRIEGEWGSSQSRAQMDAKGDVPDVVSALASVYADHPDYDSAWTSEGGK